MIEHDKTRLAPRKWMKRGCTTFSVVALVLLTACAQRPTRGVTPGVSVVVVPSQEDGHVGAVVVHPLEGGKAVLVNKPYVEANLRDKKTVQVAPVDKKAVDQSFGKTLAALPAQPKTFLLYFVEGTDELNPNAKQAINNVVSEIARRPSPDVAIVGHTDFTGTDQYNDTLSLQRAVRVKELLVQRGIPAKIIQTAGRGKREPLVKTSRDVVEPKNRRVEIIVR